MGDELDARVERKSSKKEVQMDWYEIMKRNEMVCASLFLRKFAPSSWVSLVAVLIKVKRLD